MKIWLDDVRTAPVGYIHCHSVNEAIEYFKQMNITEIDCDHDLGDFAQFGGDGIKILDWMIENGKTNVKVKLHTMNPVGRDNMQRMIERYFNN